MSDLADDLAAALARDKFPAVVVYDPETGPGQDPGVYLPQVDDIEETDNE